MCDSNNLYYRPKPHEFRVYRADGTRVHKGDKLVGRHETWDFDNCSHPRKIFVESIEDPNEPHTWPNRISQEFYPSVFDLGIYDATDDEWTFKPEWDTARIDVELYEEFEKLNSDKLAELDKPGQTVGGDKTYTTDSKRNKEFWEKAAEHVETDMWARIDRMYQRVTKCDGTVILTPKAKADIPDATGEFNRIQDKPWVTPGPSEAEIAAQADRVRRADIWVETGVWTKSDNRETYTHEDAMRDLDKANSWVDSDDSDDDYKYRETDIADEDDKAELVRESDEQREIDEQRKSDNAEETDIADGN